MSRMWGLAELRYDDGIVADAVSVFDEVAGELKTMTREDAIALARSRDAHLIEWWPSRGDDRPACIMARLTTPPRWERLPRPELPDLDSRLWFEGECGGHDVLLPGQGHTFPDA